MTAALQIVFILAGAGVITGLLRRRRVDPWEVCRPRTNLERELRWIDRHAAPWEADERKSQALRRHHRNTALDRRVARLARSRT